MKKIYLLGFVLMVLFAMTMSATAMEKKTDDNPNPGVLPPDSTLDGLTYGEWSTKWWPWALASPEKINPVSDRTGKFCAEGQSPKSKVWFLAGTWQDMGKVTRKCAIPDNKYLFFPIVNTIWVATESSETVEDGLAANKAIMDKTTLLEVKVDGVPVQNLWKFRTVSPAFDVDLYFGSPIEEVLGVPKVYFGVADGYYLMLKPLSPGKHTINILGKNNDIEVNVIYHLDISSPSRTGDR